ncbi:MAG: Rv2231c family pyridoxal phosphate-dependent protein CobC [Rhodococcus sp. (in: high G+C Gram-positive bacteria)]
MTDEGAPEPTPQSTGHDLRHHGDAEVEGGMVDFAVNVRGDRPPEWLRRRLARAVDDLAVYPSAAREQAVRERVAERHNRSADEVLLLAGAAEGFAMLPRLHPRLAAVIHPSFTEPEFALRAAGVAVHRSVLPFPYRLADALIPEDADMVVVGNPTNPTSIAHPRDDVLALRRPGRLLVVDEAFADTMAGEPESVASQADPDVLVLRSLTKSFALAGLRCGYALGNPDTLAAMGQGRAHWPLGTLQLTAIAACCEPDAVAAVDADALAVASEREYLIEQLRSVGADVLEPAAASFVLVHVHGGAEMRSALRRRGFAVRRCDTFPGLSSDHLRVAVRRPELVDDLIAAWRDVGRDAADRIQGPTAI